MLSWYGPGAVRKRAFHSHCLWTHHEAPGLGAAENAVCVCDGGERGAFHQKGASGTEERGARGAAAGGLLPVARAAFELGEGSQARWSRPVDWGRGRFAGFAGAV